MTADKKSKVSESVTYGEQSVNQEYVMPDFIYDTDLSKPALLLHSCCGPCSTAVVEELIRDYKITVYFYNPNITDEAEYKKRLESQMKFIDEYNGKISRIDTIEFIEGVYEPGYFLDEVRGLEHEPEGGERCVKCFRLRLEKTAGMARLGGYDFFAAALSVSPHKNYRAISEAGRDLSLRYGVGFIDRDYKKNGGYERSIELSKLYSLYRQNYCGCKFSKGEK